MKAAILLDTLRQNWIEQVVLVICFCLKALSTLIDNWRQIRTIRNEWIE